MTSFSLTHVPFSLNIITKGMVFRKLIVYTARQFYFYLWDGTDFLA